MSDRDRWHRADRGLNRGDYRGDFGPEGRPNFEDRGERRERGHADEERWKSRDAFRPAGFGFGPEEGPHPRGEGDEDWQVTRPARGRGRWAGDWAENEQPPGDTRERGAVYRGRGPKGYRRADERIREEVCDRLTDDWSVDASDIAVVVNDGEVTLSGYVPSRDQKRRAEQCIERINGVRDVVNSLRVGGEHRQEQDR